MTRRVHYHPNLIFSVGSRVVLKTDVVLNDGVVVAGTVAAVQVSPLSREEPYQVQVVDGPLLRVYADQIELLALVKEQRIGFGNTEVAEPDYWSRIFFSCVVGSRAFGLENENSDTDRRGIYLPTAAQHWSLHGVPEQLENEETQECYWELEKFLSLALKANPNVLECLYTPLIEKATPLAQELLAMRTAFLSKLVYQTYNGYVWSQFRKIEGDLRNKGAVRWKHAMHLIRLLISGIGVLRTGEVTVRIASQRDRLLALRGGEISWEESERWRLALHQEFEQAFRESSLPDSPDFARVNAFLLKARRAALGDELP